MTNKNPTDQWHLRREINFTHILTTIMVIVSAFVWGISMETRMAITETKVSAVEINNNKLEAYLIRIEGKVDRIKR